MTNVQLAVYFFFQLGVILLVCRAVGVVAKRLGQPQVVAEMIAGVLLGPSLFGLLAPEWQQWVFPRNPDNPNQLSRDIQGYLFPASQLGLALYMFVVGMEFRVDIIRENFRSSVAVSVAGMLAPFLLGAGLAWYLYNNTQLFPENTQRWQAMIFLGASLCITAFPMLARIIHYKGLTGTLMGTVAIGAGAIDDATAWCLLAVVLASIEGKFENALLSIGGGIGFVLFVLLVVRPLLQIIQDRLIETAENGKRILSETGFVVGLALMAFGAWFTDRIDLHAVFGAFVVGSAIPRGVMHRDMIARIQPLTVGLLLPLFFTFSGLNTRIGLLNSAYLWAFCGLVLVASILGKGFACWGAARASGLPNREALGIGALMNARGLMELIIINIGLQRGVISDELFAILVIMAVVTTLMASPIFDLLRLNPPASNR
ncbi:MAG: cation:proton antiporter [Planctomycetes bacterium]|nr:cation:proton antiporter [Planctomycetota bacterium]